MWKAAQVALASNFVLRREMSTQVVVHPSGIDEREVVNKSALKFGDPDSIKIRDSITEDSSPIQRMRAAFGFKAGKECGACRHYKLQSYMDVHCDIYQLYEDARGLWQPHWDACGKWKR